MPCAVWDVAIDFSLYFDFGRTGKIIILLVANFLAFIHNKIQVAVTVFDISNVDLPK